VTEGPTSRERAARNVAVALVAWATYRTVLATGLLLSGLASVSEDPAATALIERYATLQGRFPDEVVGYAGPVEPEPRHQMVARYTLAPLLLAPDDAHRLVLVDLESDAALADYVAKAEARILVHPRPGLAIVERLRGAR
jgi:hypothetical protein